jgi:hypothetical protein
MRGPRRAAGRLLVAGCLCIPAAAEQIAIESRLQVEAGRASVVLVNKGDAEARDLALSVELAGREQAFPPAPLRPGERREHRLDVPADVAPPGTHPLLMRLSWRDRNGWPLSGVNVQGLVIGQPSLPDPGYDVSAGPLELTGSARWRIDVLNLDGRPRRLRARVLAPRELRVEPERFEVELGPHGFTRTLEVTDAGALPGASYPVFVLLEQTGGPQMDVRGANALARVRASAPLGALRRPLLVLGGACLALGLLWPLARRRWPQRTESWATRFRARFGPRERAASIAVLAIVYLVLGVAFPPAALLSPTTPTGGDTPAHNYLVSHLAESLRAGTVISWAGGWWTGFPMFQFYFPLPYAAMALGSWLLPQNVVLKIGSMAGVWALPVALWLMARRAGHGLQPALAAAAAVPLLFVDTHSMWGVNVRSTLAGMIANSWSFALFCALLGHAVEDLEAGRPRRRTALLTAALCLSHFFTTLVAAASLWLLLPAWGRGAPRRLPALLLPQVAGFALAGFWLLPLVLKTAWSVEFGGDWDTPLLGTLPGYAPWLALGAVCGLVAAARGARLEQLMALMLGASLVLYQVGGRLNASFPNVRFWPFLFFALVMLAALGLARVLGRIGGGAWLAVAAAAFAAAGVARPDLDEGGWYRWNMRGAEAMPAAAQLETLAAAMRGTPGRFVSEQGASGRRFGSDRVFEALPATIGKALIAGGIVNSATGALFAYTVQCEFSQECAGFPKLVSPPGYDLASGLRHAELFSVSHVVAHSAALKRDLAATAGWSRAAVAEDYELFARDGGPAPLVEVLPAQPLVLRDAAWKERAVEWFAQPALLERPVIFAAAGQAVPAEAGPEIGLREFAALLAAARRDRTEPLAWSLLGPFPHAASLADPLAWNPLGRDEASLRPGPEPVAGRGWRPALRDRAILLDALLNPALQVVAYAHVALHAAAPGPAELWIGVDDEARVFWNGRELGRVTRRDPHDAARLPVSLEAGRNDLLLKVSQRGGAAMFAARVTAPGGAPLAGLAPGAPLGGAPLPAPPASRPARAGCHVEVQRFDDHEVRFTTDCPGQPHLVKQSQFPNWRAEGADGPFLVTPHFQLVYPHGREVALRYGSTAGDHAGRALSLLALAGLLAWPRLARRFEP